MPIHFVCPHCGVATNIDEKMAGQTGPCANCGQALTVPSLHGRSAEPTDNLARNVLIGICTLLGLAGLLTVAVLLGMVPNASHNRMALRSQCADNLRQIARAMQAYEAANGCFPPAYVADTYGKPMYSWRALLLPYLDHDLADRFHYDEPWNSARNRNITELPIDLYQCPAQPHAAGAATNYMMVVGAYTISNGPEPVKMADITDGPADTIMVVEAADSEVAWAEPQDLQFDRLKFAVNEPQGISSHHAGGANVAFCAEHSEEQDDLVRFLKNSTDPRRVKAMLVIDGGESDKPENK